MSTANGTINEAAENLDDLMAVEVDNFRKLRAMQQATYAAACGLPGVPNMGPLRVTNNVMNPPAIPTPAASPAPAQTLPAAGGLSTLAKLGIGAALMAGGGGLGLGIAGLLAKAPAPVPIVTPATPGGQVTIGINPDGTLYDPGKSAQ